MNEKNISTFIPLNKKGLNCLEACLLSLTSFYYDEYRAALLQCFNFNFVEEPINNIEIIGNHFDQIPTKICNYIDELYNIRIFEYLFDSPYKKFDFVCQSLLENEVIVLMISAYYCNWLQTYHTTHQQHFIIILGKTDKNTFICSDPMFMGSNLSRMSFDDFINGCQCVWRIERQKIAPPLDMDYLILLTHNHLEKLQLERSFNLFINELYNTQSLDNEYTNSKSVGWPSILDKHIGYFLSGTHQLYAEYLMFLTSLKTYLQPLTEEAERSLQISKKWNNLRAIFYKSYLKNTFQDNKIKIVNIIKEIEIMSIDLKDRVLKSLSQ